MIIQPAVAALSLLLVLSGWLALPVAAQQPAPADAASEAAPGPQPLQAAGFVVRDIRVEGLQRLSTGTVLNYLPVQVGERLDPTLGGEVIRELFATGFFRDVSVGREGDTLVIDVLERPSIASIDFVGNKELKTEVLTEQLERIGFSTGRVFNRAVFDSVEQELRRSYFALGRYGVEVESTVTPLERNRVDVRFDVIEGAVARIKSINVVGNEVFDDEELTDLFNLTTKRLLSFFTKSDQYSRQKLTADIETLRSYYLDRGYLNFNIDSTQVSITPDRRDVYLTINVSEGNQFRVAEVKLAGTFGVPADQLIDLVDTRPGDIFSRRALTESSTRIGDRLGVDGYVFANINAVPDINEEARTVSLTYFIDPGKRVYARRITFEGNTKTQDEVLRREMRLIEGAPVSTAAIDRSKERLQRLGFFDEVNVETPAVPGTTDQVDIAFSVAEASSGNISIGAGVSESQGFILSASISQENLFGTGQRLTLNFNNSKVNRNIGFEWVNPYFTDDGISRGIEGFFRRTNAADANISDYDLDEIGGALSFGIPVSEFDRVNLGFRGEHDTLKLGEDPSDELVEFQGLNGNNFTILRFTGGFTKDTRNSRLLPTRGHLTRLSGEVTVPGSDLEFYKASVRHQRFIRLFDSFTLSLGGEFGLGDGIGDTDALPLIENFFAGGIRSVRGFDSNTIGPRDSNDDPLGGDSKLTGRAELIMPVPFLDDVKGVRITAFVDTGAVFGPGASFDIDDMRVSTGVSGFWLSPLGPINVSFGLPLKKQSGDELQSVQFTVGTTF